MAVNDDVEKLGMEVLGGPIQEAPALPAEGMYREKRDIPAGAPGLQNNPDAGRLPSRTAPAEGSGNGLSLITRAKQGVQYHRKFVMALVLLVFFILAGTLMYGSQSKSTVSPELEAELQSKMRRLPLPRTILTKCQRPTARLRQEGAKKAEATPNSQNQGQKPGSAMTPAYPTIPNYPQNIMIPQQRVQNLGDSDLMAAFKSPIRFLSRCWAVKSKRHRQRRQLHKIFYRKLLVRRPVRHQRSRRKIKITRLRNKLSQKKPEPVLSTTSLL